MKRGEASVVNRVTMSNFLGNASKQNISRSASDTGDRVSRKFLSDVSENFANSQFKDSAADIILEPFGQSSSGRWSKNSRATSLLDVIRSDNIDFEEENELTVPSSPRTSEINEESYAVNSLATSATVISYSMNTKRTNLSKIPLPPSAASFYNDYSPHMEVVDSCESIHRLNMYLKARRDDVNAGVPGRFLHAVLGQDTSDVGSIASTIMYSFYLNESPKSDQLCTIPVINMRRADLNSHTELKWLLDSCNIDQSFLIFIDENQIISSSRSELQDHIDGVADKKAKELSNFLGMLRSAAVSDNEDSKKREAHGDWKVKQDTRVPCYVSRRTRKHSLSHTTS